MICFGGPDSLFFYQLLLPICNPSQSGIPGDPRKPFYTEVTKFLKLYKYQQGTSNGYRHNIPKVSIDEFQRWDGCMYRNGVKVGGDSEIYRRWQHKATSGNHIVQESMTLQRCHQLKYIFKLNTN